MKIYTALLIFTTFLVAISCEYEEGSEGESSNNYIQFSDNMNEVNFPSFELIGEIDKIFKHPESVVYDSTSMMLYVSNVGDDEELKTDGYISQINLNGEIVDPNWVTGLTNPRGMCIIDRTLLVADANRIIKIDIGSGMVTDIITAPELKLLSDLEKDADGNIYITDSQLNSIYILENDSLRLWKKDAILDGPAGLHYSENQMWVTSSRGYKLMMVDLKSGKTIQVADSLQKARGITIIDQDLIVGGLSGQLYGVKESVDFRWPLIDLQMQQDNFADILYIKEYNVLFVPTYNGNSVLAISVLK